MPDPRPRIYLIDSSSFIFRSFFALPNLTSPSGVPTGAVLGFCNMIFRLLEEAQPDYMAALGDTAEPTFRSEIYPEYKANRPPAPEDLVPQFPLVDRAAQGFRLASIKQAGVEADDLIATYTRLAVDAGLDVTIVSTDKDLMQLVGDHVCLMDTMKDLTLDAAAVEKKFGVTPAQLGDYLALCGDASDNVPGVPGVGPKTAVKLLTRFGDLETVLASVEEVSGKKLKQNLTEFADQARLSRRLVALKMDCDTPVNMEGLRRQELDNVALTELFTELGFTRLLARLGGEENPEVIHRGAYRTVLTDAALQEVLQLVEAAGACAVDVETSDLDAVKARLVGISLAWAGGEAAYIPLAHDYLGSPNQLGSEHVLAALTPMLTDPAMAKYGQNFKYDWIVLKQHGVDVQGVTFDPMLASYVLDAGRNSHGLDALARDHLDHTMLGFKEVAGKGGSFSMVEVDVATEYAAEDADVTHRLTGLLGARLARDADLERLFNEVEMPLWPVLARMELTGVHLDAACLMRLSMEVEAELYKLETEIQAQASWPVNINSPKQLQKLLFEDLGLTPGRKTKTGYSTDADTLADLALEHPIAEQIEAFRTLAKLKNTYIDTLPALINPRTGRVHTSYNQAVAATGRLSSSDPNLQNIPIRTPLGRQIRAAFTAPEGRVLLSADYSQVELRVLAHLSGDPLLLAAFRDGEDVHRRTAAEVFGIPPEEVTGEQRRVAKAVNFGVIYGQTDWGLSRQLRVPREIAHRYIESYFQRYAGVQTFMEQTLERARETEVVQTLLGRKRPVPDINNKRHNLRMYAERMVRNTPIQGTAADMMKLAMLRVDRRLAKDGLDAPMILTVHDELIFEVSPDDVEALKSLVTEEMGGVMELDVPLKVDTGVGANWTEAH